MGSQKTFTVVGADIEGSGWAKRYKTCGHKISPEAQEVLLRLDYDTNHRLVAGKKYKVTLLCGKKIPSYVTRKTPAIQSFAKHSLGAQAVEGLCAELALALCECLTVSKLKSIGVRYVTVLHVPILDCEGGANVLYVRPDNNHLVVDVRYDHPHDTWDNDGAFVFFKE
jgi:hypothetical protein